MIKITQEDINNGCIPVDSQFAKEIGFTSDKFQGYLWLKDNTVYLSLIISIDPGKGNCRKVIQEIKNRGYAMKSMPVTKRMVKICEDMGFVQEGEVWVYRQQKQ